ncbi:hypothetical protein NKH28_33530 [Mesorhizobium sp. M1227]|uniref:hypothetical protein n=1 Tax=Mesorhizobium sp. M1227 TaxID=2957071 RepID=UPI003335E65C
MKLPPAAGFLKESAIERGNIWELINAGRDRMSFGQRRLWNLIKIDPEEWLHHSPAGSDHRVWVVALIGRSVISYNAIEAGFDRSKFVRYGEITELGWGQADLEVAVQHVISELEQGHRTAPVASAPRPGEFPDGKPR